MTKPILITSQNLPLHCPSVALWSSHPRVFLELDAEQKAKCPYCGAQYQLVDQ